MIADHPNKIFQFLIQEINQCSNADERILAVGLIFTLAFEDPHARCLDRAGCRKDEVCIQLHLSRC
jgi:hypothetical protein